MVLPEWECYTPEKVKEITSQYPPIFNKAYREERFERLRKLAIRMSNKEPNETGSIAEELALLGLKVVPFYQARSVWGNENKYEEMTEERRESFAARRELLNNIRNVHGIMDSIEEMEKDKSEDWDNEARIIRFRREYNRNNKLWDPATLAAQIWLLRAAEEAEDAASEGS